MNGTAEVIRRAKLDGKKVQFAPLMDLCHLNNSELEGKFRKFAGRVVLRSDTQKAKLARKTKVCLLVALVKAMCATRCTSSGCMGLVTRSLLEVWELAKVASCDTALDMQCQEMHEAR